MSNYHPDTHHRRSIRLPHFDYTKSAWYFITLSTQDHHHKFGQIHNQDMILNPAGQMIENWYKKIPDKYPDIEIKTYIIMPNHMHFVIHNVGAAPYVRPGQQPISPFINQNNTHLKSIIQWFKTMTTNDYIKNVKLNNWPAFPGKLWQRNFYEHIIRTRESYEGICQYIINNPINWKNDKYFS